MIPYNVSAYGSTAPSPGNIDKLIEKGSAPTDQPGRARKGEEMLVYDAEVILKWSNGKTTRIGTIEMTADKDGMMNAKVKHVFQRLGWELVRKGFALMFYRRKWKEEQA